MTEPMFDPATALLVIDVQYGMFNGEKCPPIHAGDTPLAANNHLLDAARAARAATPGHHRR